MAAILHRYIINTKVTAVREHDPVIASEIKDRSTTPPTIINTYGPREWHIVTAPPDPFRIVVLEKPDGVEIGMAARLILEVMGKE